MVPDLLLMILGPKYEHLTGCCRSRSSAASAPPSRPRLEHEHVPQLGRALAVPLFGALAVQASAAAVFGAVDVHSVLLVGLVVTLYGMPFPSVLGY